MLFFLICSAISLQVYDFTAGTIPYILTIYFNPLDSAEVRVRPRLGVFLSTWDDADDLNLEVETVNKKGTLVKHGPFGPGSGLAGIYFKTKNYTLKFTNEGPERVKFALLFTSSSLPSQFNNDVKYDYSFPVITESLSNKSPAKLDLLTDPFIYYFEKKNNITPIIILYCVLGALCIGGLYAGG
ncbi:hypothetical protein M9Y10_008721 [Tritrichomonas musculus]|uniref:Uncharacterized protein n=1 Tax=Tritrichomonas musculus TaxID=1915356 RepID=A0ABR2IYT4_9EUKA